MHYTKLITLPIFMALIFLLAACAPTASESGMEGMEHGEDGTMDDMASMEAGVEALSALSGDEFEIAFLDAMIPHHQSAVEMATIALERAQRPETKAAAQAIIDAQDAEIAQMTAWLNEWHGRTPSGDDHGMAMPNETEALRTVAAEAFDVAFFEAMIPHHESAIDMAELVPERTNRSELLGLATAIVTTQQAEIAQFQGWLAEWG
jgi:uncharacterized protein (DUF305 family)